MAAKTKTAQLNYPIDLAYAMASEAIRILRPACVRIEIAGSVRREREHVHDVDLVALPIYNDLVSYNLFGEQQIVKNAPEHLIQAIRLLDESFDAIGSDAKIARFQVDGLPFELYITERDGSNFEALWQMRTGSAGFNAFLASRARNMGMYYKAGFGIYQSDKPDAARLDDGSEAGIFNALKLAYTSPEKRS